MGAPTVEFRDGSVVLDGKELFNVHSFSVEATKTAGEVLVRLEFYSRLKKGGSSSQGVA